MNNKKLWYEKSAAVWEEALPIGNGRLGAMIFGGVDIERLQFNEDTLWSGFQRDTTNPDTKNQLDEVRRLIFKGEYKKAEEIIEGQMLGVWTESYLPFGNLYVKALKSGNITDYKRELSLSSSVASVDYNLGGINYKREYFASAVHDVLVMRITADKNNSISISAFLDSELKAEEKAFDNCYLSLSGKAPAHVQPGYVLPRNTGYPEPVVYDDTKNTIKYEMLVKIVVKGGSVSVNNNKIEAYNSDEILFIIAAETDFKKEGAILPRLKNKIDEAVSAGFDNLKTECVNDYKKYFDRVSLDLGVGNDHLPTDERIENFRNGNEDSGLQTLLFDYGRYLLISSSRPNTQPANLQGIWNHEVRAAWSSNYTLNINAQMNYWHSEVCNLSECHGPLLEMISEIHASGKKTAEVNYNARGFVAHHNSDIWRLTTQVGGCAKWAYWQMGGGWLCRHLFEHYEFNNDLVFLKNKAYPIMKDGALFFLDWLTDDGEGHLVTCPSTSPENSFIDKNGVECSVSYGSAMDNSIIRELFENCIKTCDILNIDSEFKQELTAALSKLLPFKTGGQGQLLEWPLEYKEFEVGHRHVSHLYALYPSNLISFERNTEFLEACRKSLEIRLLNGGGHTGWSCAWIINLFARLRDSESAYKYVSTLLTKSVYNNLFDSHPPFQIDGNFGYTAGVSEMLIQSCNGYINLLPALPKEWENGSFKGLCTRGGFEASVIWENYTIVYAEILSKSGNNCRVVFNDEKEFEFKTVKNQIYSFRKGDASFSPKISEF